jgi:hypothetical protein
MKKIFISLLFTISIISVRAQVAINSTGTNPAASSMLDVSSTNKGMLMPRMTTAQRKAIQNPEKGLLVFDLERETIYFFDGIQWKPMMSTTEYGLPLVSRGATEAHPQSNFGFAVDIFGDYAVVGAPNDTVAGQKCGAVYIFSKQSGTWKQEARLKASDAAIPARFGASVSLYNDVLVVGAPNKTVSGNLNQGKAYVFKRTGNNWNQMAELVASDGKTGDFFGTSVAIYGSRIAVGAPEVDRNGLPNVGSVYVYGLFLGDWPQRAIINPNDAAAGGEHGFSVGIWESTIVAGAPNADRLPNINNCGAAYVYNDPSGTGLGWQHTAKLYNNNTGATGYKFGFSVAINGNTIVVGAPETNVYSQQHDMSGKAFKFFRTNGQWDLGTPVASRDDKFAFNGTAVATDGVNFLTGAPYLDSDYGAASIVFPTLKIRKVYDTEKEARRLFGKAVALHNGHYVIGAPGHSNNSSEVGRVYFGTIED